MQVDYLVVGSGLTGAVIARRLKDAGQEVLVVERRDQVGGNVSDHTHPSGILIHTYGPHYFRTSSDYIWEFVNRFSSFYEFKAVVKTLVDGRYENWPIAQEYIDRTVGSRWTPEFTGEPNNFEEASLRIMPGLIYNKLVKGYSEKQWGVPSSSLSRNPAECFDVREDNDPFLTKKRYQGLPEVGYSGLMRNMLEDIPVFLNFDYTKNRSLISARKLLIVTGAIDEFFDYQLGQLKYRGQIRRHKYLDDVDYALPCGQVNNPGSADSHIRTMEWKHLMPPQYANMIRGTVLTTEETITPTEPDRFEYPFPDDKNLQMYQHYREHANTIPGLLVCGRLGEYRYYDMDQAIMRAMDLADKIIGAAHLREALTTEENCKCCTTRQTAN